MTYYYEYEVKTVDLSSYVKARDSAWNALIAEMDAWCKKEDLWITITYGETDEYGMVDKTGFKTYEEIAYYFGLIESQVAKRGGWPMVSLRHGDPSLGDITVVVDARGIIVDDFASNYMFNPSNDSAIYKFWLRGEEIWRNFYRECADARESKLGGAVASADEWYEKQREMWINKTREQSACRDAIKEIERRIKEKENAKKKAEKEKKKLQEQKKEVGLEDWRTDAEKSFDTSYLDGRISIIEATIDVYDAEIERLKVEKEDWQLQLNRAKSDPYGGIRESVQSLRDEIRGLQTAEDYLAAEYRYLESQGFYPSESDLEKRAKEAEERKNRITEIYEQIEKLTKPISEKVESEDAALASKYKEASDKINLMGEMLKKASERADESLQNSKQPEKQKTKSEEEGEKMSALYNKYFEALEKAVTSFANGDRMQADSLSKINELASQMASSFNGKD